MANQVQDLSSGYIITPTVYGSTTGIAATGAGVSVDLAMELGVMANAVQVVGVVTGTTPTLDTKIQESTDGSNNWTDITGASFTQVTTSTNSQCISFLPTKRYVRSTATTSGTNPVFPATVTIICPRRTAPSNSGGWNNTVAAS